MTDKDAAQDLVADAIRNGLTTHTVEILETAAYLAMWFDYPSLFDAACGVSRLLHAHRADGLPPSPERCEELAKALYAVEECLRDWRLTFKATSN
jgi:hypothetical protein